MTATAVSPSGNGLVSGGGPAASDSSIVAALIAMLSQKDDELARLRLQVEELKLARTSASSSCPNCQHRVRHSDRLGDTPVAADESSYARASSSANAGRPVSPLRPPNDPNSYSSPVRAVPQTAATVLVDPVHESVLAARRRVEARRQANSPSASMLKEGVPGPDFMLDSGFFRPQTSSALRFNEGGRRCFAHNPERTPTSSGGPAAAASRLSPRDQVRLFGFVQRSSSPGPSTYSPLMSKLSPQRAPGPRYSPIGKPTAAAAVAVRDSHDR